MELLRWEEQIHLDALQAEYLKYMLELNNNTKLYIILPEIKMQKIKIETG